MENIANELVTLLLVAVLAESLTEVIKNSVPKEIIRDRITYVVSLVVGVVLAFAFDLNFFNLTGYAEYVSIVSAGLIASRGANYVNGFMKKYNIIRTGK